MRPYEIPPTSWGLVPSVSANSRVHMYTILPNKYRLQEVLGEMSEGIFDPLQLQHLH